MSESDIHQLDSYEHNRLQREVSCSHSKSRGIPEFLGFAASEQIDLAIKSEDRVYGLLGLANREVREQLFIQSVDTPVATQ